MKIHIQTMRGVNFSVEVDPNETVDNLRRRIYEVSKIQANDQGLVYMGMKLQNGNSLVNYNLIESKLNEAILIQINLFTMLI